MSIHNLFQVVFRLPNLIELDISKNAIGEDFFNQLDSLPLNLNWEKLNLSNSFPNTNCFDLFCKNSTKLPCLKALDISLDGNFEYFDNFVEAVDNLSSLQSLTIGGIDSSLDHFDLVDHLHSKNRVLVIQHYCDCHYDLSNCYQFSYFKHISLRAFDDFEELPNQDLDFSHIKTLYICNWFDDDNMFDLILLFFSEFHDLQNLEIGCTKDLSLDLFIPLFVNSAIQKLNLKNLSRVSHWKPLIDVMKYSTSIRYLILHGLEYQFLSLQFISIFQKALFWENIEQLEFVETEFEFIAYILKNIKLPKLKKLTLNDTRNFNRILTLPQLHSLKQFEFINTYITDPEIVLDNILRSFPNLTALTINGDFKLGNFLPSQRCKNLRLLALKSRLEKEQTFLPDISQLPKLKRLVFMHGSDAVSNFYHLTLASVIFSNLIELEIDDFFLKTIQFDAKLIRVLKVWYRHSLDWNCNFGNFPNVENLTLNYFSSYELNKLLGSNLFELKELHSIKIYIVDFIQDTPVVPEKPTNYSVSQLKIFDENNEQKPVKLDKSFCKRFPNLVVD